jgi:hypothetical protein
VVSATRDPAPLAAGRASGVFSSAGELSEDTQHNRPIQASRTPTSPAAISVCDDLRFEALIEIQGLIESFARSAAEPAWRGHRLTLETHFKQARLSIIAAIQIFKELSREGQEASSA